VGIMFTLVVVSLQEEGSKFFTLVLGSSQRVNEMRQVFEMLLLYWVWLKRDSYWKRGNTDAKESARTAICVMLRELIRLYFGLVYGASKGGKKPRYTNNFTFRMILSEMERRKAPIRGPQNTITSGWLHDQPRVRNSVPKFLIDNWVSALVMRISLWTWSTLACCPSMVRHRTKCYHRWGNQPVCPPKEPKEGYLWTPTATKYPTPYPQYLVLIYFIQKKNFTASR
jgi:hypothetical protein